MYSCIVSYLCYSPLLSVGVQWCTVVVSALVFSSDGQQFEAWSLQLCCFLRQETLLHVMSLSTQVYKMGTYILVYKLYKHNVVT